MVALDPRFRVSQNNATKIMARDPLATDDYTDNNFVNTAWVNWSSKKLFVCVDPSPGAAVWVGIEPSAAPDSDIVVPLSGIPAVVDSFAVDTYASVEWAITLVNGSQRQRWRVEVTHDGTAASDATSTNISVTGMGPDIPSHTFSAVLTGSGYSQGVNLRIIAEPGWTAYVRRTLAQAAGAS